MTRPGGELALDQGFRQAVGAVAAVGLLLSAAGFAFFGMRAGMSVLAGAALSTGNLYAFGQVVHAFLEKNGGSTAWKIFGAVKIFILFAWIWVLLTRNLVDPIPFVVGLISLPIGLSISSMLQPGRDKDGDA